MMIVMLSALMNLDNLSLTIKEKGEKVNFSPFLVFPERRPTSIQNSVKQKIE